MNIDKNQDKKILLVEDDENIAFNISVHLDTAGYSVLAVSNGREALDILDNNMDISMIITDIRMPEMDGIEFCRQVRERKDYKDLPILILTAVTDNLTKYQGFTAGTDDYITKPFDPIELLLRVQALLRRNRVTEPVEKIISPDLQKYVDSKIEINDREIQFTFTEFDIFYYLYTNTDRYISSEELLHKVLGYPEGAGNPESIRTHIKNIRSKIENDPRNPEVLLNSKGKGYFLDKKKIF